MAYRSVSIVRMHDDHPSSRHFVGLPPEVGRADDRVQLPWPRVLLIAEREDGYYLERLLADGTVVGDTAHEDAAEAREQAEWEYPGFIGPWKEVPEDVLEDTVAQFALGV